jgi:hypothetical protein
MPLADILEHIFRYVHPGQIGPTPLVNHYYLEDVDLQKDYPQFPSYRDLVALNRTNRLFYSISSYLLYNDITIVDSEPDAILLIDMLLASPNHQAAIRHLRYSPFFWDMHPYNINIVLFGKFLHLASMCPTIITLEFDFGCKPANLAAVFNLMLASNLNQLHIHRLVVHNPQMIEFFNTTALKEFTCSWRLSNYGLTKVISRIINNPHLSTSLTTLYIQTWYDVDISVAEQFTRIAHHCQVLSILHIQIFDLDFPGLFDFFHPYVVCQHLPRITFLD